VFSVDFRWLVLALMLPLGACGGALNDDLFPSDSDQRGAVTPGSVGHLPGQVAADFAVTDTLSLPFTLSDHLTGGSDPADAVVLYFTMWCPTCLSHSDHLLGSVVPRFVGRGAVVYALVDYVSGSVALSRASEIANGYAGSPFSVLADVDQSVFGQFNAAMGTTVVIAPDGVVQMNEDYRTGANLVAALDGMLP